ncbi:MAG: hypothetical protein J6A21_08035, partial [Lentisphaeria bacterium]|nr:hypothetical protein [Lentisphaeria bacterium]
PTGLAGRSKRLFRKNRKGTDTELMDSYLHAEKAWERLMTLPEGECPVENLRMLKRSANYYQARLRLSKRSRFLRPFLFWTVRGYFSCGYGLRSILRDLLF